MSITFTTAEPKPKAPPPQKFVDIIVNGKVVGSLNQSAPGDAGSPFHVTFHFPGLGFCGVTEIVCGHGETADAAISHAIADGRRRCAAMTDAVRDLSVAIGMGA